jgi:hypothetical protein
MYLEKRRDSLWSLIRRYVNGLPVGETFKRRYMLKNVFKDAYPGSKSSQETVDIYRCHLTSIGILEHVNQGKYRKLRDIPPKLSTTALRTLARDKTWKSWFIKMEDRLKQYE